MLDQDKSTHVNIQILFYSQCQIQVSKYGYVDPEANEQQ